MDTKICETCGREFSRPSWSSGQKWARQRFCGVTCANRASAASRRLKPETKHCETCGTEFPRPPRYPAKLWTSRRFCSQKCWAAAKSAAAKAQQRTVTCTICGRTVRSRHPTQKTCGDDACKRAHRRLHAGPALSARLKADYASGARQPSDGVSVREKALWPLLAPQGWLWRLRWAEEGGTFELDFADMERKLNVEIDGPEHRWHRGGRGPERDQVRDAELVRRGWRVLRIANEDVDESAELVAERIAVWAGERVG